MGWRFRKSKKIGPFRINISNKGVGYSVGTKGFRISHGADGKDRVTTSIPGTGIYSTQTLDKDTKASEKKAKSSGVPTVLIVLLALILIPSVITVFQGVFEKDEMPPPPERNNAVSSVTEEGIGFVDDSTVLTRVGEAVTLEVEILQESISTDDLIINGGDDNIAEIIKDGKVLSIAPKAAGILNLSVSTADGKYQTSIAQIIIEEPYLSEPTPIPASSFVVINTSSKKLHHAGCSYAPEAGSENRRIVTDEADIPNEGYTWCAFCK